MLSLVEIDPFVLKKNILKSRQFLLFGYYLPLEKVVTLCLNLTEGYFVLCLTEIGSLFF